MFGYDSYRSVSDASVTFFKALQLGVHTTISQQLPTIVTPMTMQSPPPFKWTACKC